MDSATLYVISCVVALIVHLIVIGHDVGVRWSDVHETMPVFMFSLCMAIIWPVVWIALAWMLLADYCYYGKSTFLVGVGYVMWAIYTILPIIIVLGLVYFGNL